MPDKTEEQDDEMIYRVNVTPGFPPFTNVDDADVPDCHDIEANVYAQGDDTRNVKSVDVPYFDLNYGLCKHHIQLKWEGWYQIDQSSSVQNPGTHSGFGNELAGVKWKFLDGDDSRLQGILKDVSAAVYPQIQFAPSERAVKGGIAEGGTIYILPLMVTKGFRIDGRPFGLTVNICYEKGEGGPPDSRYEGVGLGTAVTANTSVMVSASDQQYRASQPNLRSFQLGLIHAPTMFKDFSVFTMVGKSKDSTDHFVWAVGFQRIIHTREGSAQQTATVGE